MRRPFSKKVFPAGWLLVALALPLPSSWAAQLSVDNPFGVIGGSVIFTLSGAPGETYTLLMSTQPGELPAGPAGTLFLKPGSLFPIGSGTLDAGGTDTVTFNIPNAATLNGRIFYAQSLRTAPGVQFSNAVPFRIGTAVPSGRRVSQSVTTTPDGAKAYVVHQVDGSVSVIDAVNDVKLTELPVTPGAANIPHRPVDVAVDPDGRHAFVVNAAANAIAVIDVASDSVSGQVPSPKGNRRIAFDFSGAAKRIYITNQVTNAVLIYEESPPGTFTRIGTLPLAGRNPGPVAVLPDGRLMVGHRSSLELEVVDPAAAPGSTTVARTTLGSSPFDIIISNGEVLVPTFVPDPTPGIDGANQVLRVSLANFQVTGHLYNNVGTDYVDTAAAGNFLAVIGASTGTALIADAGNTALLENVELAPGDPTATPQDSAFVTPGGGAPTKLYVVNYFRESLTTIELSGGPPFSLGTEIPLAWSGSPRVALSGDLSPAEDGDWFFRSVNLFGGSASNPNPATCSSCHLDGASDNVVRGKQTQAAWASDLTAPFAWNGGVSTVLAFIQGAINSHNKLGTPPFPGGDAKIEAFVNSFAPPKSIYLLADGSLSANAQAGRALFEGIAGCVQCHTGPAFIPAPPAPPTIAAGIGTGLAPANVPTLLGAWSTGPYLHNGSARTLMDVLTINPADTHGLLASPLTQLQREQLVAYLKVL